MDYSTINIERLKRLRVYTLPPTYQLQRDCGNGCYGDPPGYPSYFTRSVYTQFGNSPPRSPQMVIRYEGRNYVVQDRDYSHADYEGELKALYLPLSLDHLRTRLWIIGTYRHLHNCYDDPDHEEYGRPRLMCYSLDEYFRKYRMAYRDLPSWSDSDRRQHREEIDDYNRSLGARYAQLKEPDNHQAVRAIREHYPDYRPEQDLIDNPPQFQVGMWWETETRRPAAADCAMVQRWGNKHPFNGTWCQFCGRYYDLDGTLLEGLDYENDTNRRLLNRGGDGDGDRDLQPAHD